MNRKILYAIIAVVVVIVLIVAVLEIMPSTTATMTISVSSTTAIVGQNITYSAFVSGGTPSKVIFNFGDGISETATHLSGNEYTVSHAYNSAGKYIFTATATVNGKSLTNMKDLNLITVTPGSVNPTLASELTLPSIITTSQIVAVGNTVSFTASTLQPPTATNWTIGYYIWNFGDGSMSTMHTVFNSSSGDFMPANVTHVFSNSGIYAVTLGVITFNATDYVPTNYTSNGIVYEYYPLSDLSSILSGGQYYNTTYVVTMVVNSSAKLISPVLAKTNYEIIDTEVAPGGAYSFDPAVDYDIVGFEILQNVYGTLVTYNGSSTQVVPMIATEIPTVANGGISSNYLNYTFNIRSGLKFANGDPLTAWDVYTSYIRTLLFVDDSPGTAGWILAQDLLPGGGFVPNATSYQNITSAISVNNESQTVTFHLLKPDPAFLDYLADVEGASIMDYNWIVSHGAGITFTPAGFMNYMNQGNEGDYNNYLRYNTMGSGPYMIKSYLIGQSITLVPNPYFTPIPGVPGYNHTANDTIYIQWEKDPSTALLIAESGQTDIIEGLPNYDYPIMAHLASEGKIKVINFPSLAISWFQFNFDINTTMLSSLGSGYSIPQYYFTNLDVRRAFAYAFDYTNYIDNLVGNSKYGANFGSLYTGIIPKGMPGYMNTSQLKQAGAVIPTYNLSIAKQYMESSGVYNQTINIPIIVESGDPIDFAEAEYWGSTMNAIDPNIHITAQYLPFTEIAGYTVPGQNPMPLFWGYWGPDYPFPSDYVVPMYGSSGYFGSATGWNTTVLNATGHFNQSREDAQMNEYITEAQNTGNATLALKLYDEAEVIAVNLTFYVYLYQVNALWFYSPLLKGSQYEQNPMIGGGAATAFIYLSK
ncbi:MAG: ABC transporter substrate-binding protein [Thermoplasmata archaeon]